MKKLFLALVLIGIISMPAFNVLADEPSDTDVDITVDGAGDVTANIDLSGSNLNVIVNGAGLANENSVQNIASSVDELYTRALQLECLINEISKNDQQYNNLFTEAIAKLITDLQYLQKRVTEGLVTTDSEMTTIKENMGKIEDGLLSLIRASEDYSLSVAEKLSADIENLNGEFIVEASEQDIISSRLSTLEKKVNQYLVIYGVGATCIIVALIITLVTFKNRKVMV